MRIGRMGRGIAIAIVAGLTLAVTACAGSTPAGSGGDAGKVTVTFWNGWTGGAAPVLVPKLVQRFNSEHPGIEVKSVPMEWNDISKKMPLAVKAGKGPDVAVLHGDDIATYAAQRLLRPAGDIVSSLGYAPTDFPKGVMAAGGYKGEQYAIPWSVTPLGLYVNNDVLRAAGLDPATTPTDAAGYASALAALKSAGVQGEWVDGYVFTGLFEFQTLLWQFGGDLFNADVTRATFDSEAGVAALSHMRSLITEGYSPANVAQDGNIKALLAGKTAYNWNGVWQTTNEAFDGLDWTAAPVPQIGTQKAVWSSSTHWVFPAGTSSEASDAAATFVKWMNEHSADWPETGELPAANAIRDDPALVAAYPRLAPFLAELEYAHYETSAPGIAEATNTITAALSDALSGKKTPEKALADAATKADAILAKNRKAYGG